MTTIAERLQAIQRQIRAVKRIDTNPTLVAVSKTQPAASIREAFDAGQSVFGENYVQEGVAKILAVADLPLEWHFIGPIQSNKTKLIAEHFAWVHGVDRLNIAERLNHARAELLPPINICIQVNVSGEASKSGVSPEEVASLADAIAPLPRLKLRGLMAIPAPAKTETAQRVPFKILKALFDQLKSSHPDFDTLSMGMSEDFKIAIEEGATMVRIGSAIFGPRQSPNTNMEQHS